MTRVDFYVLPDDEIGPVLTVCKLCEKAAGAGLKIYVHAPDPALLDDIDTALWTFRQGSFVAHERVDADGHCAPLAAVALGGAAPPDTHGDVLVNLAAEVPSFFSRFERVLETVHGDESTRGQARTRFAFYKERGYPLHTHRL